MVYSTANDSTANTSCQYERGRNCTSSDQYIGLEYSIQSEQIVAIMHDCASANIVAIWTLKVMYPLMLGIGCFLYTLNCVGERFNAPHVLGFMTYWISLFPTVLKRKPCGKSKLDVLLVVIV